MNEINKTLFIPLYGKSYVSKKNIILKDYAAELIWEKEGFVLRGKSKSKWLAYNMAMRARVFDEWTDSVLENNKDALVLHIGCGLDNRCKRVRQPYKCWIDCDFSEVIEARRNYFKETDNYHMQVLNAAEPLQIRGLPENDVAIVILEGVSMYLSDEQVYGLFKALKEKYKYLHVLMDIYTEFGAKASKYKNPVNEVGVTNLFGRDDIVPVIGDVELRLIQEHTMTPMKLINELKPLERLFFKVLFNGRLYRKIYRLLELSNVS